MIQKLASIPRRVAAVQGRRVKPCDSLRQTDHATSSSPAISRSNHAEPISILLSDKKAPRPRIFYGLTIRGEALLFIDPAANVDVHFIIAHPLRRGKVTGGAGRPIRTCRPGWA